MRSSIESLGRYSIALYVELSYQHTTFVFWKAAGNMMMQIDYSTDRATIRYSNMHVQTRLGANLLGLLVTVLDTHGLVYTMVRISSLITPLLLLTSALD